MTMVLVSNLCFGKERWREIKEFPGYFVSDFGRVASTRVDEYILLRPGKRLSRGRVTCLTVSLVREGRHYSRLVHRLVLEAFVGPCPKGRECDHKNADPSDNRLKNLHWVTHRENMNNPITRRNIQRVQAESCSLRVKCLNTGRVFKSQAEAARKMGLNVGSVSKVCRGKIRKTGGFRFAYVESSK